MKPRHLLIEELNYELRIRGILSKSHDQDTKRKLLGKQLIKEVARPNLQLLDPEYSFKTEKVQIAKTWDSIVAVINECEGTRTDSTYRRVQSRIKHLTDRVRRIQVPTEASDAAADEVRDFKIDSAARCLELEVLLDERVPEATQNTAVQNVIHPPVQPKITNTTVFTPSSISVSKWNLKFSGDRNHEAFLEFLERAEELRVAHGLTKNQIFNSAVELFAGNALYWYRSVKNAVNDWDGLISLLKSEFLPSDFEDRIWEQIRTRLQQRGESIVIFVSVMENLFNKLEHRPNDTTKLKYIKKNLQPYYLTQLALAPISTIPELVKACRSIDEAQEQKHFNSKQFNRSFPSAKECASLSKPSYHAKDRSQNHNRQFSANTTNQNKTGPNSVKSCIVCWNCGEKNHTHQSCLAERRKFCFRCGKPNVTTRDCVNCSKN